MFHFGEDDDKPVTAHANVLCYKSKVFNDMLSNLKRNRDAFHRIIFKVDDGNIFVIYDDIDLGFGNKKLKQGGGDAGHKGVRSISQHLGTKNFNRIRIGIGRPKEKKDVSSFVLSNFSTTEIDSAQTLIKNLCEDFENIIKKRQV